MPPSLPVVPYEHQVWQEADNLLASKCRMFPLCERREGAGSLCCGREPLRHSGAGLPDDPTEPDAGGGHQNGQGPQGRHPQQGFPPPAQRPGRHPEGEPQGVPAELRISLRHSTPWRRAEVAAMLVTLEVQEPDRSKQTEVAGFDFTAWFLCFFALIFPSDQIFGVDLLSTNSDS